MPDQDTNSSTYSGASMSGDLRNPSKSIPKGTLSGIALTFVTYTIVILAIAASVSRESLYRNANVIQVVRYLFRFAAKLR